MEVLETPGDTFAEAADYLRERVYEGDVLRLLAEHPPYIARVGAPEEFENLEQWLANGWAVVEN